ncbi:MAG TPA: phosphodiester glycosidase family protein [Kofleriaceae bacterium]|nr:phosphodiester glycosidase family protein [Kofleriaceae bacterium]
MKIHVVALIALFVSATSASAETIESETETTPYPGLRLVERITSGPSWHIHAAFVSLCTEGVSIDARSPQSTRITAPTWGAAMGARLATNGDFYRTDRSTPTVYGDAVGVGIRWPSAQTGRDPAYADDWYWEHYGWIAFGPGWVNFSHSGWVKDHADDLGADEGWSPEAFSTEIPEGTFALVSGFPELVVEGQALETFPDRGDTDVRNPRTAMGLSQDRKTFMLVVVDGRGTSVGMTGGELATLMKDLGAYTAFNLDGGGSTQMWLDKSGVLNDPSDGSPRAVANLWGVFTDGMGQQQSSCIVAPPADAGMPDTPDAGSAMEADAGAENPATDGATDPGPGLMTEGGGGCNTAGGAAGSLWAALACCALATATRRRGSPKA